VDKELGRMRKENVATRCEGTVCPSVLRKVTYNSSRTIWSPDQNLKARSPLTDRRYATHASATLVMGDVKHASSSLEIQLAECSIPARTCLVHPAGDLLYYALSA